MSIYDTKEERASQLEALGREKADCEQRRAQTHLRLEQLDPEKRPDRKAFYEQLLTELDAHEATVDEQIALLSTRKKKPKT